MQPRPDHPPVLHHEGRPPRPVGWLELFYDLVYAATLLQLGNALSARIDWVGVVTFTGLFVPLWFAWTGLAGYTNRFATDDWLHRLMVFAQMFAVGATAVSIPRAFEGDVAAYALSYAAARAVLGCVYLRAARHVAAAREAALRYATGYFAGVGLWVASAFVATPYAYLLWVVAIGINVVMPFESHTRALDRRHPIDVRHLTERYGLLTIVALGEAFMKVLTEVASEGAAFSVVGLAPLGLAITCAVWWSYFETVGGAPMKPGLLPSVTWQFAHLPLAVGIIASAVAVKKSVFFEPLEVEYAPYRWLLCGSLALVFAAVAVVDLATRAHETRRQERARVVNRLVTAGILLALAPVGGVVASWLFLTLVATACVAHLFVDIVVAGAPRREVPTARPPPAPRGGRS